MEWFHIIKRALKFSGFTKVCWLKFIDEWDLYYCIKWVINVIIWCPYIVVEYIHFFYLSNKNTAKNVEISSDVLVFNLCQKLLILTINPFYTTGILLYPLKHQETRGFLIFQEGIKRYKCHEMGLDFPENCQFFLWKVQRYFLFWVSTYFPADSYMFKVNYRKSRSRCEICSK